MGLIVPSHYKKGDKVLLLESVIPDLPIPDSEDESKVLSGPLTVHEALPVAVSGVLGYQSLTFLEIPYAVGNTSVKSYLGQIFAVGDQVKVTESALSRLPFLTQCEIGRCVFLTIKSMIIGRKPRSTFVYFEEIGTILCPEDLVHFWTTAKGQGRLNVTRRKELLEILEE